MQSDKDVEAAMACLQRAGTARNYSTAGSFQILGNHPTNNIYVYIFKNSETASSLPNRKPPLFWIVDNYVHTDSILPPTTDQHVQLDYAVTSRGDLGEDGWARGKQRIAVIGEIGLNNLYCDEVIPVLEKKGLTVIGNRSVVPGHGASLHVSYCHSSRPDFAAFDAKKRIIVTVYHVREEYYEKLNVAGLVAGVTEKKLDDTDSHQQLLGGVEKILGEMCCASLQHQHLKSQPVFNHVDVYCLSVQHLTDKCEVRRVSVNFLERETTMLCGDIPLSIAEGTNRLISILSS